MMNTAACLESSLDTSHRVRAARANRTRSVGTGRADSSDGGVTSIQSFDICESLRSLNGIEYGYHFESTKNHSCLSHEASPLRCPIRRKAPASLDTASICLRNRSTKTLTWPAKRSWLALELNTTCPIAS